MNHYESLIGSQEGECGGVKTKDPPGFFPFSERHIILRSKGRERKESFGKFFRKFAEGEEVKKKSFC